MSYGTAAQENFESINVRSQNLQPRLREQQREDDDKTWFSQTLDNWTSNKSKFFMFKLIRFAQLSMIVIFVYVSATNALRIEMQMRIDKYSKAKLNPNMNPNNIRFGFYSLYSIDNNALKPIPDFVEGDVIIKPTEHLRLAPEIDYSLFNYFLFPYGVYDYISFNYYLMPVNWIVSGIMCLFIFAIIAITISFYNPKPTYLRSFIRTYIFAITSANLIGYWFIADFIDLPLHYCSILTIIRLVQDYLLIINSWAYQRILSLGYWGVEGKSYNDMRDPNLEYEKEESSDLF